MLLNIKPHLQTPVGVNGMNVNRSMHLIETSSGYSSRDSPAEMIASQRSEGSNCSCGKSNSNSSKSTQRYISHHAEQENVKKASSMKFGYTNGCCQQTSLVMKANEQLLLQNRLLEEHNRSLLEELQVSRRFYQGTLADLSSKLSIAENRIKYLKEVISTQEEANSHKEVSRDTKFKTTQELPTTQPPILGLRKQKKTSTPKLVYPPATESDGCETNRSVVSSSGSCLSEISLRSRRSTLQGKNIFKMKEHLLEKNQNLKTDIQMLKVKKDFPRSSSAPLISPLAESEPVKNMNRTSTEDRKSPVTLTNPKSIDHTKRRKKVTS